MVMSGWWVVTWILFFHIFGLILLTDATVFFRGVGIPPISISDNPWNGLTYGLPQSWLVGGGQQKTMGISQYFLYLPRLCMGSQGASNLVRISMNFPTTWKSILYIDLYRGFCVARVDFQSFKRDARYLWHPIFLGAWFTMTNGDPPESVPQNPSGDTSQGLLFRRPLWINPLFGPLWIKSTWTIYNFPWRMDMFLPS